METDKEMIDLEVPEPARARRLVSLRIHSQRLDDKMFSRLNARAAALMRALSRTYFYNRVLCALVMPQPKNATRNCRRTGRNDSYCASSRHLSHVTLQRSRNGILRHVSFFASWPSPYGPALVSTVFDIVQPFSRHIVSQASTDNMES